VLKNDDDMFNRFDTIQECFVQMCRQAVSYSNWSVQKI